MKDFIRNILKFLFLIILSGFFLLIIHFVFIYSFDLNEERLVANACNKYVDKVNGSMIKPYNSLIYGGNKYYACAINDFYQKIVVIDNEADLIYYNNYQSVKHALKDFNEGQFGMYKDKLVYVIKDTKKLLEIDYYDVLSGELVFTLQKEDKENDTKLVE